MSNKKINPQRTAEIRARFIARAGLAGDGESQQDLDDIAHLMNERDALELERTCLEIKLETAAADAIRGRCTRPQRERCWPAND